MLLHKKTIAILGLSGLTILTYGILAQGPAKLASAGKASGIEFVSIPAGEFMMGCSSGDAQCGQDESPKHRVRITKNFEIGKYELTQAQWMATMGSNPSSEQGGNLPVETVSKLEAQQFMAKLNAQNDGYRYRLPTEAEWEYAARAGKDSQYSGPLADVAWYAANSDDGIHPVGQKKPNAWGLYDVQGNVREWVSDLYGAGFYNGSPVDDPIGPAAGRGGGPGGGPGGRGQGKGPGGRGGQKGGGQGPGGQGRGPGAQGPGGPPLIPEPIRLPPGATQQQQIDALRQEVAQLREVLRQLPPPGLAGQGGPGGRGNAAPQPAPGAAPDQEYDTLDGLARGLPVVRGGGWDQSAPFQRVSARYTYYGPTLRVSDIGFRVARDRITSAQ
ncbi:MAG: SUMF1/EgtB/PvdO family nonheme iron enzyme [Acidobacteriota bacterium]